MSFSATIETIFAVELLDVDPDVFTAKVPERDPVAAMVAMLELRG